jgi:hypothetical protein
MVLALIDIRTMGGSRADGPPGMKLWEDRRATPTFHQLGLGSGRIGFALAVTLMGTRFTSQAHSRSGPLPGRMFQLYSGSPG